MRRSRSDRNWSQIGIDCLHTLQQSCLEVGDDAPPLLERGGLVGQAVAYAVLQDGIRRHVFEHFLDASFEHGECPEIRIGAQRLAPNRVPSAIVYTRQRQLARLAEVAS